MSDLIRYRCNKCQNYFRGGMEKYCPICSSNRIMVLEINTKE